MGQAIGLNPNNHAPMITEAEAEAKAKLKKYVALRRNHPISSKTAKFALAFVFFVAISATVLALQAHGIVHIPSDFSSSLYKHTLENLGIIGGSGSIPVALVVKAVVNCYHKSKVQKSHSEAFQTFAALLRSHPRRSYGGINNTKGTSVHFIQNTPASNLKLNLKEVPEENTSQELFEEILSWAKIEGLPNRAHTEILSERTADQPTDTDSVGSPNSDSAEITIEKPEFNDTHLKSACSIIKELYGLSGSDQSDSFKRKFEEFQTKLKLAYDDALINSQDE